MNVLNRKWWSRIALGPLGAFVAIQLVPYGRDHTNPPIAGEPTWDAPVTRASQAGVFRLPQQRDRVAGVRERCTSVVARAARRR